jgi:hypothetical protein
LKKYQIYGDWGLGIGDWGLGIGDWGLGPIPNPQKRKFNYLNLNFIFLIYLNENDYLNKNCFKFFI